MKDLRNGELNKDLESIDKFYSKNPELNKLPDQTNNRIREEWEDKFDKKFIPITVKFDEELGQYKYPSTAIKSFIAELLKSQKEEIIEKNKPEIEKCNKYIKELEDKLKSQREEVKELINTSKDLRTFEIRFLFLIKDK